MATFTKHVVTTTTTVWRLDEDELNGLIHQHLTPPPGAQVEIEYETRQGVFIGVTITVKETEHG